MKKVLKVVTAFLVAFVLTGCMKMELNIEIKADKTLTMGMEMLIQESILAELNTTKEKVMEQLDEQIANDSEYKDAKVKKIEKKIDNENWFGMSVVMNNTFKNDTSISEKTVDGENCVVLTLPMKELTDQMDLGQINEFGQSTAELKAAGVEVNINIKMPAAAKSNMGTVKGDVVTLDLLDAKTASQSGNLVISAPIAKSGGMTMIFVVGGVIALAAILFFVLKKKKPQVDTLVEGVEGVHCPNCGSSIESGDTCPNCGYTVKK